ncbi:MAG: hypothetical protein CL583_14600 [Alteromonadaceae bacterium]|nr:hypothetical protein [Alteromonadaceae bacterium]|tara:strand:- start:6908 stop:7657 length:750 start_codon:yes stop_codon:yes gene_type:complete
MRKRAAKTHEKSDFERELEPQIKASLINHLRRVDYIDLGTPIFSELSISTNFRRADLCIVHKGKLTAFEVKSEADSLYRLKGQLADYLNYFDKVIVVTAPKFTNQIINEAPKSVGVWEASNETITKKRRGSFNLIQDNVKIASFLRKNEIKTLLSKSGAAEGSSVSKLSKRQVRDFVVYKLSEKYRPHYQRFWDEVKNRDVSISDLELLSPFIQSRRIIRSRLEQQELSWEAVESPEFIKQLATLPTNN